MHLPRKPASAAADGGVIEAGRDGDPRDPAVRLCLRLFGKTCAYIGALAMLAGVAVLTIWTMMQLLR